MAVNVTSSNGNINTHKESSRVIVRTSSGIPYVVVANETSNKVNVWKGNAVNPTSFTEQDTANRPGVPAGNLSGLSAAIDGNDVIHISYYNDNASSSALRYVTFVTATDTYSGEVASHDIGASAPTNPHTAITVDASNIPHVAWVDSNLNMGTSRDTVYYANKIGGSWSAAIEVEGVTAGKDCRFPDITTVAVAGVERPIISYLNSTDGRIKCAIGNALNPSSFSIATVSTNAKVDTRQVSQIAVDDNGRIFILFINSTDDLMINENPAPSTDRFLDFVFDWIGAGVIDSSNNWISPSIACHGTDVHLFAINTADYKVYHGKLEMLLRTVSKQAGGSTNDDAYSTDPSTFSNSVTTQNLSYSSAQRKTWLRWTEINIPKDSKVPLAYNTFWATASNTTDNAMESFGIDQDNAASFSSKADVDGRPLTTASVTWVATDFNIWGQAHMPANFGSLLEEVVARASWVNGNAFGLRHRNTANTTTKTFRTSNTDPSDAPDLVLHFLQTAMTAIEAGTYNRVIVHWSKNSFNISARLGYVFTDETATPDILFGSINLGGATPVSITKDLKYAVAITPSAIAKSLKYAVEIEQPAINKILSYGVISKNDITRSLQYLVKATASITRSLQYSIIGDHAITKALRYIVSREVIVIKSLFYVTASTQSLTRSLKYTIETTPLAVTKDLRYTVVITPSAISRPLLYEIISDQSVTKSLRYEVMSEQSVTKFLTYTAVTTRPAITKSFTYTVMIFAEFLAKTLEYRVSKTVSAITKPLRYDVAAEANITKSLQYSVITVQTPAKSLTYFTVAAPSTVTKSLRYAVISQQAVAKSLRYAIYKTPSAITKLLVYEIASEQSILKSLQYSVGTLPSVTKILKYTVTAAPVINKSLRYDVVAPAGIAKSLKYAVVITQSAIIKGLRYEIVTTPSAILKTLIYKTAATFPAITKPLRYDIEGTTVVTIQKSLVYAFIVSPTITRSLSYDLLFPGTIPKSLTYTVRLTPGSITKSLTQLIIREIVVSKSLRYAVFSEQTLTKSLQYEVLTEQVVFRPLSYAVIISLSVTKTCGYVVFTTPDAITKSLRYVVVTTVGAPQKSLAYAIRKGKAVTKSLTYKIVTKVTKHLRYTVLITSTIAKFQTYRTVTIVVMQKSLAYKAVVSRVIQKSLFYRIIVPTTIKITIELLKFEINVSFKTARENLNFESAKREVNLKGSNNNIGL